MQRRPTPVAALASMLCLVAVWGSVSGCKTRVFAESSLTAEGDDEVVIPGAEEDLGIGEVTAPLPSAQTTKVSESRYVVDGKIDPHWPLQEMEIESAWKMLEKKHKKPGEGVKIALIDTGFLPHPLNLLPGTVSVPPGDRPVIGDKRVIWGNNLVEPGDKPWDRPAPLIKKTPFYGHGTGAVSVIMAPPGGKVTGIAWGSQFAFYRAGKIVFIVRPKRLTQALYDAVDQGADVINISMGGLGSEALRRAVEYAEKKGVIVVAAAGQNVKKVAWPAQYSTVVSAAAVTPWLQPWDKTARGPQVKIAVPAAYVYCNRPQKEGKLVYDTALSQGTTFAAMYTSGVASLWLSYWGKDFLVQKYGANRIPEVFRYVLKTQGFVRPPQWDSSQFGPGIINARKLLEAQLP